MEPAGPVERRKRKWFAGGAGVVLLLMAGAFLGFGGQAVVHATNDIRFCTSCHEMRDNNYAEYKDSIHAHNRTGVTATCSDCHVPHDLLPLLARKIGASNDLYQHFVGKIDTKEQFEAHRLELAKRVWTYMEATDSRECRSCHDTHAMDPSQQGRTAQTQHKKLLTGERTCIDCHYGIAHHEPEGDVLPADLKPPRDEVLQPLTQR